MMEPLELRRRLDGVIAFPVTPFKPDLTLDLEGLRQNLRHLLQHPLAAIVAAAGTGELFSLTPEEQRQVVSATVEEVQGRLPVLAGAGFNQPLAVRMAEQAAAVGADFAARDVSDAAAIILRESPRRASVASANPAADQRTHMLLGQIRDELKQQRRVRSQSDFTLPMLLGLIGQLAAVLVAALALLALLDTAPGAASRLVVRLFFALWLQVFALTMFTWGRRRDGS